MIQEVTADLREMVQEQFSYRDLLFQMVRRDLLLRYKQSVMGFGWAVLMPVVNTVIFSVILMKVATIDVGVPYPLFAYTGLLAWQFFASSLRFSLSSLTTNPNLVGKVYFPREVFPFSSVIVSAVDFAVGSSLLIALMIYYHVVPTPAIIALPLVVLVHILLTAACSTFLAMANLFYRDVKYLFEVIIQFWMFGTSVLYPLKSVDGTIGVFLRLNPVTPIIDAYRATILMGQFPEWQSFGFAAIFSLVAFVGAWLIFHRSEHHFAEYV